MIKLTHPSDSVLTFADATSSTSDRVVHVPAERLSRDGFDAWLRRIALGEQHSVRGHSERRVVRIGLDSRNPHVAAAMCMVEATVAQSPGWRLTVAATPSVGAALAELATASDASCLCIEDFAREAEADRQVALSPADSADAAVLTRGNDATVISWGRHTYQALAVARQLAAESLHIELIDLRTLVPVDESTVLTSAARTRRVAIVHPGTDSCGVSAQLSARIHEELFEELAMPVLRAACATPGHRASSTAWSHRPSERAPIEAALRSVLAHCSSPCEAAARSMRRAPGKGDTDRPAMPLRESRTGTC